MKYNFYPFCGGENHELSLVKGNKAVIRMKTTYSRAPYNGYVVFHKRDIPKKWQEDYNADALQYLNIHGGITYCAKEGNYIVYGFDCAHVNDEKDKRLFDASYVMLLTEQMEEQIINYKKVYKKWRNGGKRKRLNMMQKIIDKAKIKEELGFGAMIDMLSGGRDFEEVR